MRNSERLGFPTFVALGSETTTNSAEQLALTDQLFDAAPGELGVVARKQPCLVVGDFNVAALCE